MTQTTNEEDVKAIQLAWTGKACPVDQAFVAGLLRAAESIGYKIISPAAQQMHDAELIKSNIPKGWLK